MHRCTWLIRLAALFATATTCSTLRAAEQFTTRPPDDSPLAVKAEYLYRNLLEKHWLDGLYVSITPTAPDGVTLQLDVNTSGNVIHAGVWTGRYLGGVAYWYAVTGDPAVREHGNRVLQALRVLRAVTGKPGLLARGYTKGHGPVVGWERDGNDSVDWHQGQGEYADYRWYGDVSVDNLNAVLYGYALFYDLAADEAQKAFIAAEVDELMTHLLDNHCRIIDVDGEPTQWGHVGIDPDPQYDAYYKEMYGRRFRRYGDREIGELPLRAQLMLLPDLLIAHHVTGKSHYLEFYRKVVARHRDNPDSELFNQPITLERLARFDHSPEGQQYEALYNLIRYERDPELLKVYRSWVTRLWENNWTEGNALFAFTTLALLPEFKSPGEGAAGIDAVPHGAEGLRLGLETLQLYPLDRVFRPVLGSARPGVELNPHVEAGRPPQSVTPVPIHLRPHDNEYEWKGNPYRLDGYLKPHVTSMAFSADDPMVAWFTDSHGRGWMTLDRGRSWRNLNGALMGSGITSLVASKTRTFVIWGQTGNGVMISRDGGLSWRPAPAEGAPEFPAPEFDEWTRCGENVWVRIDGEQRLLRSSDEGQTSELAMAGWRIPIAQSVFATPWGIVAGGPGGTYVSADAQQWTELTLWEEQETGGADFLHAYWMGRYYGFIGE